MVLFGLVPFKFFNRENPVPTKQKRLKISIANTAKTKYKICSKSKAKTANLLEWRLFCFVTNFKQSFVLCFIIFGYVFVIDYDQGSVRIISLVINWFEERLKWSSPNFAFDIKRILENYLTSGGIDVYSPNIASQI